jgi:hypothetical protein
MQVKSPYQVLIFSKRAFDAFSDPASGACAFAGLFRF